MKTGRTLQELAAELERQKETRKDFLAPQGVLNAQVIDGQDSPVVVLAGMNGSSYSLTRHAHQQVADHLGIPQKYYERMKTEQPQLLAENLNTWLHSAPSEKRMVRTLDGQVRAFMSPRYRPLDNFELAEVIIPKLITIGAKILSCELTETRMYIKAILPDLCDDLPEGAQWGMGHQKIAEYIGNEAGKLVAALTISNSEVGNGSVRIEPSVFTTWCTNLAIIVQAAMKKYHVGRSAEAGEDLAIYRDETRQADDRAFFLKVADVTNAAFDRRIFDVAIQQIKVAAGRRIVSEDLKAVADQTVKQLALPERTSSGLLSMLARGGDLTQWGLSSAVTAVANTAADYEVATDLERAGGKILALTDREWKTISTAVAA